MHNLPSQMLMIKCLTIIQIEFGIWKCWYLRRGENRSTRRKTSRSKDEKQQQTQPTYMTPSPGIEPGPHWCKVSTVYTMEKTQLEEQEVPYAQEKSMSCISSEMVNKLFVENRILGLSKCFGNSHIHIAATFYFLKIIF